MIGFILYVVIGICIAYYILKFQDKYTEWERMATYSIMALFWPIAIIVFIIALIISWIDNNRNNGLFV